MKGKRKTNVILTFFVLILAGFVAPILTTGMVFVINKASTVHEILGLSYSWPLVLWALATLFLVGSLTYLRVTDISSSLQEKDQIVTAQKAISFLTKFIPLCLAFASVVGAAIMASNMRPPLAAMFVFNTVSGAVLYNIIIFLALMQIVGHVYKEIPISDRYKLVGINARLFLSVTLVVVTFIIGTMNSCLMIVHRGGGINDIVFAILFFSPFFLGATVLLVRLLQKSITLPVKGLSSAMKNLSESEGDLTKRLDVTSRDEIGELAMWFNKFVGKIQDMMLEIRTSGEILSDAATDIESSTTEQSAASSQQAASIQQISATAQEMTASSDQMAENVALVVDASRNTLATALEADKVMGDSATGMEEIKESARLTSKKILSLGEKSQSIGDVVEIIKDVTNQTNLLALNASIEASKAGEAGKGFSIVAGEIKKLAENVDEAAKEIKEIVSGIQGAVNKAVRAMEGEEKKITWGSQLAEETKRWLEDINRATKESASAAEQIGESISQQNVATQEMSGSIQEISQGVNEAAEENTRINQSLTHLAQVSQSLSRSIKQFKVSANEEEGPAR